MKHSHLSLRLPAELARALARLAKARRVPKSQIAREAVARYVAPSPSTSPPLSPRLTAVELARRWAAIPALDPDEATVFGRELAATRAELPAVTPPWA